MKAPNERNTPDVESVQERSSSVPENHQSIARSDQEPNTEEVRVFLQSSWAKPDTSTSMVFDEVCRTLDGAVYTQLLSSNTERRPFTIGKISVDEIIDGCES